LPLLSLAKNETESDWEKKKEQEGVYQEGPELEATKEGGRRLL